MSLPFADVVKFRREFHGLKTITTGHDLIGRKGALAPIIGVPLETLSKRKNFRLLDIGAYDRALGEAIKRHGIQFEYRSVDPDRSFDHDFNEIEDADDGYDVVAAFELIEHLKYDDVVQLLHHAYRRLLPGGLLFLSTPHPYHPTRFVSDASHVQHWPPHDLYAVLRHIGFESNDVQLYGVVYRGRPGARAIVESIRCFIWRCIGLEFRGGILAVAKKSVPS
jgi:SAM-dependent methyltransferase